MIVNSLIEKVGAFYVSFQEMIHLLKHKFLTLIFNHKVMVTGKSKVVNFQKVSIHTFVFHEIKVFKK